MKSIMSTYPGFQDLPRGVKQLLVTSESLYFDEARTASLMPSKTAMMPGQIIRSLAADDFGGPFTPGAWNHPVRQHSHAVG
jgi:hypothetical protein